MLIPQRVYKKVAEFRCAALEFSMGLLDADFGAWKKRSAASFCRIKKAK